MTRICPRFCPQIVLILAVFFAVTASAADSSKLQIVSMDDLLKQLRAPQQSKPLLFYVGPHTLYVQAHIPGSEYAGQGSTPQGLDTLRRRIAYLRKKTPIVLYCGCCPWSHCPNVNPAYDVLKQLEFTNVKVLYIPNNFGIDWVDKGYPVASGE